MTDANKCNEIDADFIEQDELDAAFLLTSTISKLRARVAELEAKLAALVAVLKVA